MHATILACGNSAATYLKPCVQQQSSGFIHKGRRNAGACFPLSRTVCGKCLDEAVHLQAVGACWRILMGVG